MTDRNFNPLADDVSNLVNVLQKTIVDLGKLLLATPPPTVSEVSSPEVQVDTNV